MLIQSHRQRSQGSLGNLLITSDQTGPRVLTLSRPMSPLTMALQQYLGGVAPSLNDTDPWKNHPTLHLAMAN